MGWARPGFRKDSISKTFAANLLPLALGADAGLHGEHRPCLVCGFCDDVCPAGILPHMLHRYVSRNQIDESLVRYRISDCIDCNLCTYVCPSKIPVAALMAEGKRKVMEEGLVTMEKIRHRFALKGLEADQPEAEL
jgi:Na+-translocating ferredoxin:NAD+ oxidoreductase RnfC subunit